MLIYDLLPGDIVHLAIRDQVPADGLFLSGFSVVIDESSLTGESENVMLNAQNAFLLSGTKVKYGSCKRLITTVGMRTQWGKLMVTLTEGRDDETPFHVKLIGVVTIIARLVFFFVVIQGTFMKKLSLGTHWIWSGDEAFNLLEYFDCCHNCCDFDS
ncbi:unnamed protein product [Brassica oleracea var. botrytis]